MSGFFKSVLVPEFEKRYATVKVVKYAALKKEKKDDFIGNIKSMERDYIYVTDINTSPCITARKKDIRRMYRNIDRERIAVVVREIESWYLAGLTLEKCRKLKVKYISDTDTITKERFNAMIPRGFSRIDFMAELLKTFSVNTAKRRNTSFRYFTERFMTGTF